jgi:hypothetical protein
MNRHTTGCHCSPTLLTVALVLAATFAPGCGKGTGAAPQVGAPVVLGDSLLYIDGGALIVVDPSGRAGPSADRQVLRLPLSEHVLGQAYSLPDPSTGELRRVAILDPLEEALLLLSDKRGDVTRIAIGLPFDALDVSASGRWAVAYQPQDAAPKTSLFAFPNALAIVDLASTPPSAQALRLPSAGTRPRKAVFVEGLQLTTPPGSAEPLAAVSLAFVFVQGGVVPIDLTRGRAGKLVPLGGSDDLVLPAEVLFARNAGDSLRGTNGQVYVLAIALAAGTELKPLVTLDNVITPGSAVQDIELFFTSAGRELLLAAAGNTLVLVDGYTGVAERFTSPIFVDTLARFEDATSGRGLALGYGKTSMHDKMLRLDPFGLDERRASGMETLDFATPVAGLEMGSGATRAVVTYRDAATLGILDLSRHGEVLDVRLASAPQARWLAPDGDHLFVVSQSSADNAPHLADITLGATLTTCEARLDAPAAHIGQVGDYVFVDHGDAAGSVTFFPKDRLTRADAVMLRAFGFVDFFERQ